mgnify:CR=1 FL=1
MEIRTLRYFLVVAREESFTRAAEQLFISQPTLSKQLKSLEEELGKKLFVRHSFSVELTEEGRLLRTLAEDMITLEEKIKSSIRTLEDVTGRDVYLGLPDSYQVRYVARIIKELKESYPNLHYHITSGDTLQVTDSLDKGILDFAVLVEPPNYDKYNSLMLPLADYFGLIMQADDELAKNEYITIDDLVGLPLFCSEQSWKADITRWCGNRINELKLEGSYHLPYNASMFTKEGLGYLLTFENLIDTSEKNGLVFRLLKPKLECKMYLIWKKNIKLSPIAQRFLDKFISSINNMGQENGNG